jgi:hypothetical protein
MSDNYWDQGPEIDGLPGRVGDLVFWVGNSRVPWWIAEWQPQNGKVFAIVNATGDVGTAPAQELSRNFRDARAGSGSRFLAEKHDTQIDGGE